MNWLREAHERGRRVTDAWIRVRLGEYLALTHGNWSAAARLAGMDRNNLRRLARRVGVV